MSGKSSISKRLGYVLVACFALNALGFLASAVILETSQRGIGTDADLLIENSTPSVAYLSNMRTHIWRLQTLAGIAVRQRASEPPRESVRTSRQRLHAAWKSYMDLPPFLDEPELQERMKLAMDGMERSFDEVVDRLRVGDPEGAAAVFDARLQPAVEVLDDELSNGIEFHRVKGGELAREIAAMRSEGASRSVLSMGAGMLFAALAAFVAVVIVRQNARLLEAQVDELGQFAGRVAHDIKNPLSAVGLVLALASRKEADNPELRRILERGTASLGRIQAMLAGLLAFAQAGARPEPGAHTSLSNAVESVVDEVGPLARDRSVELRADPCPPVEVSASLGVVVSLLSNLLGNAVKYMGDSQVRKVTVRVKLHDSFARVEVVDTGPGIPEAIQARLFQPYVRGNHSGEPGHGLGLATVRRLAEAHGGSVGVESREGAGALFWFELPREGPAPRPIAVASLRRA